MAGLPNDSRAAGHHFLDALAFARTVEPANFATEPDTKKRAQRTVDVARKFLDYTITDEDLLNLIQVYVRRCNPPWSDAVAPRVAKLAKAQRAKDTESVRKPAAVAAKKAERFPNKKGTWAEIAQKVGVSTRRIQVIAAHGVLSRAFAERLAPEFGCHPDELLKGSVRRGRRPTYVRVIMRLGREFTFRRFVIETDQAIAPDNPQSQLFFELAAGYEEHRPPAVFASSEEFQTFAQAATLPGADSVREMATVWKAYKAWVVDRVAERARDAIETEEPDPDEEFN